MIRQCLGLFLLSGFYTFWLLRQRHTSKIQAFSSHWNDDSGGESITDTDERLFLSKNSDVLLRIQLRPVRVEGKSSSLQTNRLLLLEHGIHEEPCSENVEILSSILGGAMYNQPDK